MPDGFAPSGEAESYPMLPKVSLLKSSYNTTVFSLSSTTKK